MGAEFRLTGAGRRRLLETRHPWVFRDHLGAGDATSGALVRVLAPGGEPLGIAAYSAKSKIALRFLAIDPAATMPDEAALRASFVAALERRAPLAATTDAVRLISSEADGFPGLIVDAYADTCVLSALTPFAELLVQDVVRWLGETLAPDVILAKNDSAVRELEGLPREVKVLHGTPKASTVIREGDVKLSVPLQHGQKTGLFLDQRANRLRLRELVPPGARVLDVFSYVGAFALQAATRAGEVLAVDESARATAWITENAALNGFTNVKVATENAFPLLRQMVKDGETFDVVVLDPPAFAKNKREIEDALRGYRELNVRGFRLVKPGGVLVTASCSYHVDETTFEGVVRAAAADAGRDA
ncbi:MAG: class I SAM-dependent rRNA methyltransferase, partial [Planctomycetes bacterium]|nr:class I SAM-dependent rRNA methyltransferase [Planctomycetota bacterium]